MTKMGRPKKDVADRLSEIVHIRLTKYERAAVEMKANSCGMTLSEWIRNCLEEEFDD